MSGTPPLPPPPPSDRGDEQPPSNDDGGGGVALKDDPQYAKYFKMLKMGLPKGAVVVKMSAEGLDPAVLDMDPEKPAPGGGGGGGGGVPLKDDPTYSKYLSLIHISEPTRPY